MEGQADGLVLKRLLTPVRLKQEESLVNAKRLLLLDEFSLGPRGPVLWS